MRGPATNPCRGAQKRGRATAKRPSRPQTSAIPAREILAGVSFFYGQATNLPLMLVWRVRAATIVRHPANPLSTNRISHVKPSEPIGGSTGPLDNKVAIAARSVEIPLATSERERIHSMRAILVGGEGGRTRPFGSQASVVECSPNGSLSQSGKS
jgi:hypothetical protein